MTADILHDRWRILAPLGHGAMGEVFLVEELKLRRREALKILMPMLAGDPMFVSRFRREARAINRLRHPNIVCLYDFGQLPDERFYLSMEYAEGVPLSDLVTRTPRFEIPRTLHLIGQLVQALHHAHTRGVVHRDLKPDNLIVVGDDEQLKVLDFGIAKIVAADQVESVALSGGMEVWGTPAYMSPERASGVGNDPRSDLYSIGCIAYELLVGAPPFVGSLTEILFAHASKAPKPMGAVRPKVIPPELEDIVMRCLVKDPARRFQSAAALADALRNVPGYPQPKQASRRRFVASASSDATGASSDLRGALRRLAEALLDRGLTDPRLVGGVAILRDHEQIVARLEAAQDALEHEADALRETLADREASLRFALSELEFAASRGSTSPLVDEQVRELRSRLDEVGSEGVRVTELERKIDEIVANRTERLTALHACYVGLDQVVNDLVSDHIDDETIHELAVSLAVARAQRTQPVHQS